ncbi:UNVERIFIED_CONTAM: hypothetical protein Sradi_1854300 [Sesamum radiatum]|uniref:Retrotransposon Copia-like N-terminal domain-containing protein n=1 Tax=Sesamum radiatum TaxID=300843 RepID=A0AAW2TXD0_SESRA
MYDKDVFYIHPSEHSSLALTSSPLDGTNFMAWRRAVYVSLGTKMKLGFIDGTVRDLRLDRQISNSGGELILWSPHRYGTLCPRT